MSPKALSDELAGQRAAYTGERPSQVRPAMDQALCLLSSEAQGAIVDVLRATAKEGVEATDVPRLHDSIRRILFPEAVSRSQQELEVKLFIATAEARDHLIVRPPASLMRPTFAVSSIEPGVQSASVHLDRYGLGPLLMGLLPQAGQYQVDGVAGLRYRQRRRHVELLLLETQPQARIVLPGIDKGDWASAIRFVEQSHEGECRWLWNGEYRAELSPDERERLNSYRRVYGPAHLGSSLFRRHRILAGAMGFSTRGEWKNQWKLDWIGGPSTGEVGARLSHPIFGLPGAWDLRYVRDKTAVLHERISDQRLARGHQPHEIYLFRQPPYTKDNEAQEHWYRSGWIAWKAWESEEERRQGRSLRH
ncbi:hypothetical protein [Micromonospora sp. NPDC047730]|uniref:hypothetical protein n=1 Tax=Micromonospora sp. NPDC047730 TaxID=3364253 RepID=UPI003718BAA3